MSVNVLKNQSLDIDISLVRLRRGSDGGSSIEERHHSRVPLSFSSIINLELIEATGQMGARGELTINNKFKILNQLDIFANSPDDLYVDINIVDVDLLATGAIPEEDCTLRVVGLVTTTNTGSLNVDDNIAVLSFEEAFVAKMKQTRWDLFEQQNAGPAYANISDMFNDFNDRKFYRIAPFHGDDIMKTERGIYAPSETIPAIFAQAGEGSVYDVMIDCLSNTTFAQGQSNEPGKVASCRFKNSLVGSVVSRQLSYTPLITKRHQEFIKAVASGKAGGDFADVYLETFSTGPFANNSDPNSSIYNQVEAVNIMRPNYALLKERCWGHYEIVDASPFNPSTMSIAPIRFQTIVDRFADIELGNQSTGISIPTASHYQMKKFQVNREAKHNPKQAEITLLMARNKIFNKVINSFVVHNETISIDAPGRVYRQPGKFIKVEQDQEEDDVKKLWYINHVQHSISNGEYRTKIYASRFFGENTSNDLKAARDDQKTADQIYLDSGSEEYYLG